MINIKIGSVPSPPKTRVLSECPADSMCLVLGLAISSCFVLSGNVAFNTKRASAELRSFSAAIS